MRRVVTALVAAGALAGTIGYVMPAAQGGRSLTVKLDGLPPGSAINMLMNVGKIPNASATGMASDAGDALLALDLSNLGKNDTTAVEVYVGRCPDDSTRVYIVAQGQEPPPECNRRLIGAFLLNNTGTLTIHPDSIATSGLGLSTPVKIGIAAGGAGAVATIIGVTQGDNNNTGTGNPSTTTSSSQTTTSQTSTSSTTTTNFTQFNGTYTGTATATQNQCSFTSPASISGVLNVNSSGQGTWQKTHVNAGQTFSFTVNLTGNGNNASFNQTTTSGTFTVQDQANINGNTMTLTQTFTDSASGCKVVYTMNLTRT